MTLFSFWFFVCLFSCLFYHFFRPNQNENKEPNDVRIDSVTDGPSWPCGLDARGVVQKAARLVKGLTTSIIPQL
jgi:hypothetical protein